MRAGLKFPAVLEAVVAKALGKQPGERQQSILELQHEFEDALSGVSADLLDSALRADLPSNEGATDVSFAVNRLLKSAKMASEAVREANDSSTALSAFMTQQAADGNSGETLTGNADTPEVSSWAQRVLNRSVDNKEEDGPNQSPFNRQTNNPGVTATPAPSELMPRTTTPRPPLPAPIKFSATGNKIDVAKLPGDVTVNLGVGSEPGTDYQYGISPPPLVPPKDPAPQPSPMSSQRALDPSDLRRFEEPVNKQPEVLNKFSEAVDVLLDAAIMPQTTEDSRRSLNKLQKLQSRGADQSRLASGPKQPIINPAPASEPEKLSGFDPSRFEQPVNKGALPAADGQPARGTDWNKFAEAVDSRLDAAMIKQDARPVAERITGTADLPQIDSNNRLAALRPTPEPEPPPMPTFERAPLPMPPESQPPQAPLSDALRAQSSARLPIGAQPPSEPPIIDEIPSKPEVSDFTPPNMNSQPPNPSAPEDANQMKDAFSRLIEAAKRAPEPGPAGANPEALNRKIEAVKKKIEALKSVESLAGKKSPVDATTSQTGVPQPGAAPGDAASLSEAVNRLLEAAQRQEAENLAAPQTQSMNNYKTDPPQSAASPYADPPGNPRESSTKGNPMFLTPSERREREGGPDVELPPRISQNQLPPVTEPPKKLQQDPFAKAGYTNKQAERLNRAADIIQNAMKSSNIPEVSQEYLSSLPGAQDKNLADQRRQSRQRVKQRFQAKSPPFWVLLTLLVLVLGGTGWYYQDSIKHLINPKPKVVSVDSLIGQGDFEHAKKMLLDKKKTEKNGLTTSEQEKLNDCCINIAKQEVNDDPPNWSHANTVLQSVSRGNQSSRKTESQYKEARKLIKQFKKKQKPEE